MTKRLDFERTLRGPAYILDDEAECLSGYAQNARGNAIEIGCGYGGSTTVLLINMPLEYTVTSIDPFITDSMGNWKASEEETRDGVARSVMNLMTEENAIKSLKRWTLNPIYSHDAFADINNYKHDLGLLFVDGDHRYSGVLFDIENWGQLLIRGGYLLMHDSRRESEALDSAGYFRGWSGPTTVAKNLEHGLEYSKIDEVGSITVFRKL